jgi:hypothetical protein
MAVKETRKLSEPVADMLKEMEVKETHVGLVLETFSRTDQLMSDVWATGFYAKVWNPETLAPENVSLGNSEFGVHKAAVVDASPETKRAFLLYEVKEAHGKLLKELRERLWRVRNEKFKLAKGKFVRVVRGRKVPKGTEGYLFWMGTGTWGERVGLKDKAGTVHWTAASNVEVDMEMMVDEVEAALYGMVA